MEYKAVLFDLDGTLLNTLRDISDAANTALAGFGFTQHPEHSYRFFVGKGLRALALQALPEAHRDETTLNQVTARMLDEYSKRAVSTTTPFPGIPELLDELTGHGIRMAILSNKPQTAADLTVSKLLPNWRFEVVAGASPSVPLKPDPASALQIARQMNLNPGEFVYLGDSDIDMKTANAAGMYPVGAMWGFQTAQELLLGGAKLLFHEPYQLMDLFQMS